MTAFPPVFLDQLRDRVPVSAVVGRRVTLTKKGRDQLGLCPFHNEKTPSFTVNDDKGFFHCFGCGAHGDVIEFEMRVENLSFPDAVERLAAEAGLDLPQATPEDRARAVRRATLYEALEAAADWYARQLAAGGPGLNYLRGRGLSDDTLARFRLGWAPASGLRAALPQDRFPDELLIEAGLLRRAQDGRILALFRERVIFPITDRRGRVIAFGGRILGDGQPKYLNTPETPLFHKGRALFGIAPAREAIGRAETALVVEGYMDTLALHQAGVDNAVAPLGTAVTEAQLELLWRLAGEIVLCLDGDSAGQDAQARALERALPMMSPDRPRRLRFARLPAGRDPDDVIRGGGRAAIDGLIQAAAGIADSVWSLALARHPATSPEGRAAFRRALYAYACRVPDPLSRRALLDDFRWRLAEFGPPIPPLLRGRSVKNAAPAPGGPFAAQVWARALAEAATVRTWLENQGVDWPGIEQALGGVGFLRGRVVKGKFAPGEGWDAADTPTLWEPDAGETGLVILPAWACGPDEDAPLDLVAWDPREGVLALLTGEALMLGADLLAEAWGFEARGLSRPVPVAEGPLSWLRRVSRGERCLLLCDWRRAWDALGGAPALVAETVELGERLDKAVRPPALPRPKILVEGVP